MTAATAYAAALAAAGAGLTPQPAPARRVVWTLPRRWRCSRCTWTADQPDPLELPACPNPDHHTSHLLLDLSPTDTEEPMTDTDPGHLARVSVDLEDDTTSPGTWPTFSALDPRPAAPLTPEDLTPPPLCPTCGAAGLVTTVETLPSGTRVRTVTHADTDCAGPR